MFRFMIIFACFVLYLLPVESAAQDFFRFIEFKGKDGKSRVGKWGEPKLRTPATILYYYLEEKYSFVKGQDGGRCTRMVPVRKALILSGIQRSIFEREVEKAFEGWSRVTNLTFVRTNSVEVADLIIGAQAIIKYNDIAFTNIKTELLREGDVITITKAAICINPLLDWRVVSPDTKVMPSVIRAFKHEIGHVFGLEHTSEENPSAVMSYKPLGNVPFIESDIAAVQFLYGSPQQVIPPK